ncbi:MAG: hypothetical protein AB1806_20405 [Acidobacteriota bacterium]
MAEQPKLAEELSRMEEEPLLDIEKALVAGCLILGVVLLVALGWLSSWVRPGT